ncbi:MAG: hypothetical protein ACK44W_17350, partial [Planctomycetota bacterium]
MRRRGGSLEEHFSEFLGPFLPGLEGGGVLFGGEGGAVAQVVSAIQSAERGDGDRPGGRLGAAEAADQEGDAGGVSAEDQGLAEAEAEVLVVGAGVLFEDLAGRGVAGGADGLAGEGLTTSSLGPVDSAGWTGGAGAGGIAGMSFSRMYSSI